jgi:hemolysin activation/secretion protein
LDGINQSFPVEGYSYYGTAFAERLLWRDRAAKMYAYADLKLTRTRSFIDDIEIESQRRNLTIGRIGLRGENNIEQGKFTWDVNSKFGLDLFDAYVFDKSIVNPHFHLVAARFTLEKGLGDTGLSYKATLAGQQSDAILPSSEQFSIGGWSTVRGFHADNMYGDSGAYIQNTLEWTAFDDGVVAMTFSAGLDAGYIHPSALRNWSQDYLFGASLGVRFEILDHVTVMAQGGHALSRPEDNPPNAQPAFEGREAVGFLGVKIAL